jgi:hypothetical protein
MFAQALHSHPGIVCFREVFNGRLDYVNFGIEGYDDFSERERAARNDNPAGFLNERIFSAQPPNIGAVGFKLHYAQHWDFPGIIAHLAEDTDLRVIHLRRRNTLRTLVSIKLAEQTGVWVEDGKTVLTATNASLALRHPAKAAQRVGNHLTRSGKRPVVIAPDELTEFVIATHLRQTNYAKLFAGHETLDVEYEDVSRHGDDAFAPVLDFLGVAPAPLTVTLRRQNPEPLHDLIENYDELYAAFENTPEAAHFDG